MAYEKQTWRTGDVITEEKLNHIEDGIANAGGYNPLLTVTPLADGEHVKCTFGGEEASLYFYETDDELADVLYKVFLENSGAIIPLGPRSRVDLEPASSTTGYRLLNSCEAVYFSDDSIMVVKTGTAQISSGGSPK